LEVTELDHSSWMLDARPQACDEDRCSEHTLYPDLQDSNEIRLLYLQPGSSGDKVKCTIKHAKLSDQPQYEALSYMWGPHDCLQTILVNDFNINVRENMWLALQHLRLNAKTRVLWVDAICINQQNIHERNHQVTQMGKIYNQAKAVIVWLGSSDSASELAFKLLSCAEWIEFVKPPMDSAKIVVGTQKLTSFYSILTRDYWTRLWIIQEFLMAKDFTLQCGNDTCTGFRFAWFMEIIRLAGRDFPCMNSDEPATLDRAAIMDKINTSVPARLCRLRSVSTGIGKNMPPERNFGVKSNFEPRSLFSLFTDHRTAKCGDKRDNILGLHSLAINCCKEANPIDYSVTWEVTLRNLVRHQTILHHSLPTSIRLARPESVVALMRDFYSETKIVSSQLAIPSLEALERFAQTSIYWPDPRYSVAKHNLVYEIQSPECLVHGGYLHHLQKDGYLVFGGYLRGRVCYTSPLLREGFSYDKHILPQLTPMLKLQIEYICSLCKDRKARHPYATTETDLVDPIDTDLLNYVTYGEGFQGHLPNPLSQIPVNSWCSNVCSDSSDEIELAKNFVELLYYAQQCMPPANHILAFEENGLIFFATKNIQVGDLVYQFPGSDVLAVIEPVNVLFPTSRVSEQLRRLSRGVNFLASPSNVATDICGKPMSFDRAGPYAMTFEAAPSWVKTLCRASNSPNGEHNILKTNAG
jgi:hypothetical protein